MAAWQPPLDMCLDRVYVCVYHSWDASPGVAQEHSRHESRAGVERGDKRGGRASLMCEHVGLCPARRCRRPPAECGSCVCQLPRRAL